MIGNSRKDSGKVYDSPNAFINNKQTQWRYLSKITTTIYNIHRFVQKYTPKSNSLQLRHSKVMTIRKSLK